MSWDDSTLQIEKDFQMSKCKTKCLPNQLAGIDSSGVAVRSCEVGDVPGGYVYVVPFKKTVALSSSDTLAISPMTKHGGIPIALILDSTTSADLSVTNITGPNRKSIGPQGPAASDVGTIWMLSGFIDREILKAGYPNLPPSIGLITPDQSLTVHLTNASGTNARDFAGDLVLWVPGEAGDRNVAALGGCLEACVINAVRMYMAQNSGGEGCQPTGNEFGVGLFPIPFSASIPATVGGPVDIRLSIPLEGGMRPVQMKIDDALPAGVTIDAVTGPDGQPIGLLGDGISPEWSVDTFQDWDQVTAGIPNLPPNVGEVNASQGVILTAGNSTVGALTMQGIMYVYNAPNSKAAA